jgi:hypothetical protein
MDRSDETHETGGSLERAIRITDVAPCETCCGWTPQVFVRDDQPPRDEACPVCGRRVAISLIHIYHLVDLDRGEVGMGHAASSGKMVPITRE